MLMEVRKQAKVFGLTVKYALMREMLNKATFISNIVFMILNNSAMIIQWIVLYSLQDNVGGYTFKQILLLWGIAAATYGFSRFFFKDAFNLSNIINSGKLDAYLVQPKNVLLAVISASVSPSALGDFIYGIIMLILFGISFSSVSLFILFTICGGLILTSIAIILGSLSFWIGSSEVLAEKGNSLMVNFATYPDGIFKGIVKVLLYTLIPIGITTYIPVQVITEFNLIKLLIVMGVTVVCVLLGYIIFYKGLKRYSSSNLMSARV